MNNRRLLVFPVVVLGLVMVLLGQVATVAAVPPDREPLGEAEPYTLRNSCDFEVQLVDLTNTENITTFYDQEGNVRRSLITGALKVELTNLNTGKSIKLNIPGPGLLEDQADGTTRLTGTGPWLFYEHGAPELPSLALVKGRTEFLIHEDGNLELLSLHGTVQDLCQVLADL